MKLFRLSIAIVAMLCFLSAHTRSSAASVKIKSEETKSQTKLPAKLAAQSATKPQTTLQASSQKLPQKTGDAVAGQWKADNERCIECHGVDGQGHGHIDGTGKVVKFPKLAGQSSQYMMKQLDDFKRGARHDDFMQMMAKTVSEADLLDIVAFFSEQKPMQAEATVNTSMHFTGNTGISGNNSNNDTLYPNAKNLYLNGDARRQIPACASCHGIDGKQTSQNSSAGLLKTQEISIPAVSMPAIPRLAGQEWRYLQKQLFDWQSNQRKNFPFMHQVIKPFTEQEINEMASYLSALN